VRVKLALNALRDPSKILRASPSLDFLAFPYLLPGILARAAPTAPRVLDAALPSVGEVTFVGSAIRAA
jgi:hypothetical protein